MFESIFDFPDFSWDDLTGGDEAAGADVVVDPRIMDQSKMLVVHTPDGGHIALEVLGVCPGHTPSIETQLGLSDPLSGLGNYRFEIFTLPHDPSLLMDVNGDGIPDQTVWGTPVEPVHGYMRSDGTWVEGHFRTVADGHTWNNLSSFRP